MRRTIAAMWQKLRTRIEQCARWVKNKVGERGLFGTLFLIYAALPDYDGRNHWWAVLWTDSKPILIGYSRYVLIAVGLLLIWLDHRRILSAKVKRYDLDTLKGKADKLHDDIQEFVTSLGAKPELKYNSAMNAEEFTLANHPELLWENKLHYGYVLRFKERAHKLYLECGEQGVEYMPYNIAIHHDGRFSRDVITEITTTLKTLKDSL